MPSRNTIALAAVTAVLALSACGGDEDRETAPKRQAPVASEIRLAAVQVRGGIGFDRKKIVAAAGRTRIVLDNRLGRAHNVRIHTGTRPFAPGHEDVGGTVMAEPGAKSEGIVNLKPGRYTFLCNIGGHWQAGQRGSLIVR